MFSLNVSCPVCKTPFQSTDSIYSTNCGHVFHYSCMTKWRLQYSNCPQCRSYNPTMSIIYLNFDDSREYEKVVDDLNAKLESSKDEIQRIQEKNKKSEKKTDNIQRLYNISEQIRAELEDKIHKKDQENEIQIENHSKEMQIQKTLIEALQKPEGLQNLFAKINEFSTTNLKLQRSLTESETLNKVLLKKIEMLEQKLKQESKENVNKTSERTRADNSRRRNKNNENSVKGEAKSQENNTKSRNQRQQERRPYKLTQPNDCRVLIKDFPSENLVYPLADTVTLLAKKMSIDLTANDISDVKIAGRRNFLAMPNKIVIQVEFKNIDFKTQFLSCRNRLKFDAHTKDIQIKEHINDVAYPLFMYANRNLRHQGGYEYIACKDNKVYAKKKLTDTKEILIENKTDVDKLLGRTNDFRVASPLSLSGSVFDLGYFD